MKKNKILAIGIPSYNGEKYLDRCIPTFIAPELEDKIEIYIVNDGSKDNTQKIAEEYAKKYPKIVKVINKENGGHGSAVNAALYATNAKYYKVVDCDDWVDTKELIKLVDFLEKNDVDLVSSSYEKVNMVTGISEYIGNNVPSYEKVYKIKDLDTENLYISIHATTYRTELLKKNNIRLQEKTFFVDVEYQLLPFEHVKTIAFVDFPLYKYMVGNVNQSVDKTNFVRRYDDHNRVVYRILDFLKVAKLNEYQKKYIERVFTLVLYTHYALSCYYDNDKERGRQRAIIFDKYLKENNEYFYNLLGEKYKNIAKFRNNNFDLKQKVKISKIKILKRILFN